MTCDTPFVYTKSSFSTSGDCVGWHHAPGRTSVVDTKLPNGPVLQVTAGEWLEFTTSVASGTHSSGRVRWSREDGAVVVSAKNSSVCLRFTDSEWRAFRSAVLAGETGLPFAEAG
jgi:Domain of unknown function (DUF397)